MKIVNEQLRISIIIIIFSFFNIVLGQLNSDKNFIPDDIYPCFSPDGKNIAFSSNRDGGYHIWLKDIEHDSIKKISNFAHDMHPSWNPDGTKIAFSSFGSTSKGKFKIYIMNRNGSNPQLLSDKSYNTGNYPCWSPNGRQIVWTHDNQLWIANIDGSNAKPLTKIRAKKYEACGSWSPDSKQIVYLAKDAYDNHPVSQYEVRIINSDGTNQHSFLNGIRANAVKWSPDSKYLFLVLKKDLIKINLKNFNKEIIYRFDVPIECPFDISYDLKNIVYSDSGAGYPGRINIIDLNKLR